MNLNSSILIRAFTASQKVVSLLPTCVLRLDADPARTTPMTTGRLMARTSTIPNAGRGLFCRSEISRNEVISQVKGRKHSLLACYFFVKNFSHVFTLSSWFLLVPDSDDVVQLANHHFDDAAVNALLLRDPAAGTVKLVARRDIHAGEEIFVTYHDRHLQSQAWARKILQR